MEVALLGEGSIKIRSKLANFVVNPNALVAKTEADAIILFNNEDVDTSKVADFRAIISGPGEYEIKGVKITSIKHRDGIVYRLVMDKMDVVLGRASDISKTENIIAAHVVVIEADELPADKAITSMQPSIVIFYGEKAEEAAMAIKEGAGENVSKFVVTFEKLPQEMEVVTLG